MSQGKDAVDAGPSRNGDRAAVTVSSSKWLRRLARAARRDDAAAVRDRAAQDRDAAAGAADAHAVVEDSGVEKADVLARGAADRGHAADDRDLSARDRRHSARDRDAAGEELRMEGTDQLTGALRRRVGLAAIAREMAHARRSGESLLVAYLDVEGLKQVNDRFGHRAGDEMLRRVVHRLRSGMRSYDLIVRMGGDEFVVLLPGQDEAGALRRFADIQRQLDEDDHRPRFTVGLAMWDGVEDVDVLLARADGAMLKERRGSGRRVTRAERRGAAEEAVAQPGGLAADAARREVSGELHDCAVQMLLAMHRDLDGRRGDPLAVARGAIERAVEDVRRISHGLGRGSVFDGAGLVAALRGICETASARGVVAVAEIDPDVIDGIDAQLVYLAALELVENSVRHGQATQIHLELRHNGIPGAELIVGDNGRGIEASRSEPAHEPGIGLELLRRRVVEGGGTLNVLAGGPTGTRTVATFPPHDLLN